MQAIPEKKEESAKAPVAVSNNKWEGTTFAQDQDGKMTAKFKRLMGIKDTAQGQYTTLNYVFIINIIQMHFLPINPPLSLILKS